MNKKSKVMIIGNGGRENALAWKISQSPQVEKIFIAPGNGGTQTYGENIGILPTDIENLYQFAKNKKIDLTIVGPELPLSLGIVNLFESNSLNIFGPSKEAARIESSKVWSRKFLKKINVPGPEFAVFDNFREALSYVRIAVPCVVKADGLAAGKGVFVCQNSSEAETAIKKIMVEKVFGQAGKRVVVEELLKGEEVSVIAFCDGKNFTFLPLARDYKRALDNNKGLNTGGMGAYAPFNLLSREQLDRIGFTIFQPVLREFRELGTPYKGALYAGLMITAKGIKVLEFNARFGDPETQVQLPLLKSDLFEIINSCVEEDLDNSLVEFSNKVCVSVVLTSNGYPQKYDTGKDILGLDHRFPQDIMIFHAGTKKVDTKIVTDGGRVLNVTAVADTFNRAREKVYQLIGNPISFSNMRFRKDIALKVPDITKIQRIAVLSKITDTRAVIRQKKLESLGFRGKIKNVILADIYSIDKQFDDASLAKIAESLANPVSQNTYINKIPQTKEFTWAVETGFLPGVTDNVASTAKEIIEDLLKIKFSPNEGVYTSQLMFVSGDISEKEIQKIANSLINPLIQRVAVKSEAQFTAIPKVMLVKKPCVDKVKLNISDTELVTIGKSGISNSDGSRRGPLALDLTYLKAIQKYFQKQGRDPTDIELESIAQTWSEHCKHTIFADPLDEIDQGLFNTYIKKATDEINKDFCVSVFTDNSGAIEFDDQYLITHKVETHNSPSALDPFGGAITGIVGVNRDAIGFGKGARPIVNIYGFCFAPPTINESLYKGANLTQKMLAPRRIMDGVIEGVNSGGNCSGIPTPSGFIFFDKRYQGKPLVFVGTLGLLLKKINNKPSHVKKAKSGDYIVMVGGRVGLDGIHGATFSSEAMDAGSPAGAVQIGDPITQKKLSDALIKEARDLNLYNSITDNGAGGLSCSVAEMAKESGGCLVNLEKVPLKYPGLDPWQVWISESQERMTLAVPANKWKDFYQLMQKRGVEATVIGEFTDSGKCLVKYFQATIMDVGMHFLHEGLPPRILKSSYTKPVYKEPNIPKLNDYSAVFLQMLKRLNIASFAFISEQYDHEVQGNSVIKPLSGKGRINSEATVIKPVLNSEKGVILSSGLYPSYSDIDTYQMAAASIDTAIRNVVCAGADLEKIALLDNFCWCSSTEPERLGQLKQAVQACYDYAKIYQTPFISGKDSMFNDFKGFDQKGNPIKISIPPTLLVSSIGIIDNVIQSVSLDLKFPGDLIYVLGETFFELGGSEFFAMHQAIGNLVPKVNARKNKKLYEAYQQCVQKNIIASAIGIGRGGLGVALAKTSIAGMLGIDIALTRLSGKIRFDYEALFSESQGRIIVSINPKHEKEFERLMKGNSFAKIGVVTNDGLITIKGLEGNIIVKAKVKEALINYQKTFKDF